MANRRIDIRILPPEILMPSELKPKPWNPPKFDVWQEHEEQKHIERMRGGILKQLEEREHVD